MIQRMTDEEFATTEAMLDEVSSPLVAQLILALKAEREYVRKLERVYDIAKGMKYLGSPLTGTGACVNWDTFSELRQACAEVKL